MSTESPSHILKNLQAWIIIFLLGVIAVLAFAYVDKSPDKRSQQEPTSSDNSPVSKFAPGLAMITIPAGSFEMDTGVEIEGDSAYKLAREANMVSCSLNHHQDCDSESNRVNRKIKITLKSFAMSKTEVTFAQYDVYAKAVSKPKPDDEGWGRGNRPVINVSWDDAVAYARWLSIKTGNNYRLPSETEWVYAARAGSTTKYSWGDDIDCSKASYEIGGECYYKSGNGDAIGTLPVGNYKPNAFGLFDIHGNVEEWVRDCYELFASNQINFSLSNIDVNGRARESCSYEQVKHVVRGGSWNSHSLMLTFVSRDGADAKGEHKTSWDRGFRIAQDI